MITRSGQYTFVNREFKIKLETYFPAMMIEEWWLIPMKVIHGNQTNLPYYGPYGDVEAALAMGALLADTNG